MDSGDLVTLKRGAKSGGGMMNGDVKGGLCIVTCGTFMVAW